MTVTYNAALKDTRMNAVVTAIDAGTSFGVLEIGTAGFSTSLVSITLQKPSFTEASGVITAAGVPLSGLEPGQPAAIAWQPHHARAFRPDAGG